MNNSRGFTVVELMVTIVIVSVMATFSYPYFQGMKQSIKSQSAANEIVTDLQLAKLEAIKENRYVVVEFFKHGYIIFLDDGRGEGKRGVWKHQDGERIVAEKTFDSSVEITTSFKKNHFRFKGVVGTSAGVITLTSTQNTVKSKEEKTYKIIMSRLGRLRQER